jgi:hypothetical protein
VAGVGVAGVGVAGFGVAGLGGGGGVGITVTAWALLVEHDRAPTSAIHIEIRGSR